MVGGSEKKVLRRPFSFLSIGNIHWQTIKLFLSAAFFSTCCSVAFRLGRSWPQPFYYFFIIANKYQFLYRGLKVPRTSRSFPLSLSVRGWSSRSQVMALVSSLAPVPDLDSLVQELQVPARESEIQAAVLGQLGGGREGRVGQGRALS